MAPLAVWCLLPLPPTAVADGALAVGGEAAPPPPPEEEPAAGGGVRTSTTVCTEAEVAPSWASVRALPFWQRWSSSKPPLAVRAGSHSALESSEPSREQCGEAGEAPCAPAGAPKEPVVWARLPEEPCEGRRPEEEARDEHDDASEHDVPVGIAWIVAVIASASVREPMFLPPAAAAAADPPGGPSAALG